MSLFFKVFGLILIAEMGDKTQFLMIAMASRYKIREILVGISLAIAVLNGFAIAVGAFLGGMLPTAVIGLVAGVAFLWFACTALEEEKEEREPKRGKRIKEKKGTKESKATKSKKPTKERGAALTVFGTFLLAELGDKTQLTALTLAADSGGSGIDLLGAVTVFLGATLALLAADLLGLMVGFFLGKTLPKGIFSWISFAIFGVFGIVKLLGALEELLAEHWWGKQGAILGTVFISAAFAAVSLYKILKNTKNISLTNKKNTEKAHESAKNTANR